MFYAHLWLGVTVAFLVVIIAVTGILLNHKRALGLMPEADFAQPDAFAASLPLPALAQIAMQEVSPEIAGAGIDRMDVRPSKGLIKVRFRDDRVTEVILALHDGALLSTGARSDSFIEQLHSGHVFGDAGFLLSDVAAGALILILISGFWMWLYPHSKAR
jgi:uncharacterized iron-regulated membrane protein